jgi:hypothetical protein
MRPRRGTLLLPILLLGWPSAGCIQDRLTVDLATIVHGDGSCSRRVSYRLVPSESQSEPAERPRRDADPFVSLLRLPNVDAWTVRAELESASPSIVLEGDFSSPNAIGWDYWRPTRPHLAAARNYFSFAMDTGADKPRYSYSETWLDPAAPLRMLRFLARALVRHEDRLAADTLRRLPSSALRKKEIRAAIHDTVTLPFTNRVARIAARPVYGPRERAETAATLDTLDWKEAVARLQSLDPSLDSAVLNDALDSALGSLWDAMGPELEAAGLPPTLVDPTADDHPLHVHATLVMPAPIVRANTCFQGDTATWDFDGEDLYGRGFEMSAVAVVE